MTQINLNVSEQKTKLDKLNARGQDKLKSFARAFLHHFTISQ